MEDVCDNHVRTLAPTGQTQEIFTEDLTLAQAILGRDRKATARFVGLHSDRVNAYVWRRLAPKVEMVDDVVQEIFLASWRAIGSYNGRSPLEAWIMAIARFKVEDYYRQVLSRQFEQLEPEDGESVLPAFEIDLDAGLDCLRDAQRAAAILEELPYEYTLALRWRYWEGQSAKAMAIASGRTEKAIERLLARAREQFKQRWTKTERRRGE